MKTKYVAVLMGDRPYIRILGQDTMKKCYFLCLTHSHREPRLSWEEFEKNFSVNGKYMTESVVVGEDELTWHVIPIEN